MRNVRLGEIFNFDSKSKILAKEGKTKGKHAFYTSSKTLSKYLNDYQFQGEHLIFGTGGSASVHYNKECFSVSSDCLVAKPTEHELFNTKYTYYFLKDNIKLLEAGFRGAGLRHISKAYIENILIPLPTFSIQNQIVSVLDKAINVCSYSEKLIEKLSELKESVYLSSFGIKAIDHHLWDLVRLEKLALEKKGSMRTGPFGSNLLHEEFEKHGDVLVLGLENVATNYFKRNDKFITKAKYEGLKGYQVYPRDLLIALMGTGTTGKSAIVPENIPVAINTKHLAAITLNHKLANPYYISSAIQFNPSVINQIELKNKGAVIPGINLAVIKALKFKLPPIHQQNQFEQIVRKIEESLKTKILLYKQQAELLIDSISFYAFQGKLKTNLEAFSLDDRVVDYVEKEYIRKQDLDIVERKFDDIKQIVLNFFGNRSFTFPDLEEAVKESFGDIEYELNSKEKGIGLKDWVFHALDTKETNKAFLNQEFEIDKNIDAEKGIDGSRIIFSLNL